MEQAPITPNVILEKVARGKSYTLLNLLPGKTVAEADEEFKKQLQMGHLAHLFTLEQQGHISVFGPVRNDDRLIGIIIFNTTDQEAIKELMKDDPYIKDGYLSYTLHEFFSIPGQTIK